LGIRDQHSHGGIVDGVDGVDGAHGWGDRWLNWGKRGRIRGLRGEAKSSAAPPIVIAEAAEADIFQLAWYFLTYM
jgi:hypothetical protein